MSAATNLRDNTTEGEAAQLGKLAELLERVDCLRHRQAVSLFICHILCVAHFY